MAFISKPDTVITLFLLPNFSRRWNDIWKVFEIKVEFAVSWSLLDVGVLGSVVNYSLNILGNFRNSVRKSFPFMKKLPLRRAFNFLKRAQKRTSKASKKELSDWSFQSFLIGVFKASQKRAFKASLKSFLKGAFKAFQKAVWKNFQSYLKKLSKSSKKLSEKTFKYSQKELSEISF